MKRLSLILLCSFLSTAVFCQSNVSFSHLYNQFSQEKNVEKVSVGGLLMFIAKPFMYKYANGINISSVKVMSLDACSYDVKCRFNALVEKLNDNKYELLLRTNEKNEKTRIYARLKNNAIRELIIVCAGDEPAFVHIKGKIKPEEVQTLVNSKNK